jgi:hypothetical protein
MRLLCAILALCSACGPGKPGAGGGGGNAGSGGGGSAGSGGGGSAGSGGGGGSAGSGGGSAASLATALRGNAHFLIGMGNDLANNHDMDGAYTLGTTLDLHYCYLVGLPGAGGWPDWNANGSFVNIMTDSADAHGVVPMFTLYMMAARGDGNLSGLDDPTFMQPYWDATRLLFQRLALFGKPAVVHVEPDFWGYAEMQSGGDPTKLPVKVSLAPDCSGLAEDVGGMARCILRLGRMYAPKAVIGLHASEWGGTPAQIVAFLKAVGADGGDFLAMDLLDRDAGCFEAHTDPNCMRGGTTGWYWDESNATSPNFHDFFAVATTLHQGLNLPMLWWQIPFGVPSTTPGGTAGHYRDNRVHYLFAHVDEMIAAGGVGAAFGTGAGNQTYITSDGGQFQAAVGKYFASPSPL